MTVGALLHCFAFVGKIGRASKVTRECRETELFG
jgi:hypothetical protein